MNKKHIEGLLREWQGKLRLSDWRLRVEIVKAKPDENFSARIRMRRWDKTADVQVVKFSAKEAAKQDPVEMSIIHELLHLHMNTFEPNKPSKEGYDAMEAAIDCIAWALYRTKYPRHKDLYKP